MEIIIEKLSENTFRKKGIQNWPIWEKEVAKFDWTYDETEEFYVIEGKVIVNAGNNSYEINRGDFVTCPKGLNCKWEVKEYIKKHYRFIEE
jgi:uncharacterized cupin superfamily protein